MMSRTVTWQESNVTCVAPTLTRSSGTSKMRISRPFSCSQRRWGRLNQSSSCSGLMQRSTGIRSAPNSAGLLMYSAERSRAIFVGVLAYVFLGLRDRRKIDEIAALPLDDSEEEISTGR